MTKSISPNIASGHWAIGSRRAEEVVEEKASIVRLGHDRPKSLLNGS